MALGAFVDLGAQNTVFHTGLSYLQAGAAGATTNNSFVVELDYFAALAAVKTYLAERQVYFTAGIMPMVNIRSTARFSGPNTGGRAKVKDIRDTDVVGQIGIGLQVPTNWSGIHAGAEISYNRGLTDVNTGPGSSLYNEGFIFSGIVTL